MTVFNRKFKFYLAIFCVFIFSACSASSGEVNILVVESGASSSGDSKNILLIIGEGGPSGNMFRKAAETYSRENGGEIFEVHSGDEFVDAIKNFVAKKGTIDHLEYFGHGNEVGLYVNQTPGINGGVYANDPALNKDYLAASIYELSDNIFSKFGWIKFNGCNVANGFPLENSLAQSFANYFDVDTVAPLGPTEFSRSPYAVDPIENSNYLDSDFAEDVYMVTTYSDKNFVVVKPQEASSSFEDVRVGQSYFEAVEGLVEMGLDLGDEDGEGRKYLPYKNVTYAEAQKFCEIMVKKLVGKCAVADSERNYWIRNLKALKMLTDAYGVSLKNTNPWYNSYVWWAKSEGLLTVSFTDKKWFTRGEMAELTWNFINHLH